MSRTYVRNRKRNKTESVIWMRSGRARIGDPRRVEGTSGWDALTNTHGDCQGLKTSAVVATCHCKFGSPQPCWWVVVECNPS